MHEETIYLVLWVLGFGSYGNACCVTPQFAPFYPPGLLQFATFQFARANNQKSCLPEQMEQASAVQMSGDKVDLVAPLVDRGSMHLFLSTCNETPRKLEVYASVFRGV